MPERRGYYSFFMCCAAVLAMRRLVPTPSKAISSSASLPIVRTVRIMPRPKALCWTISPAAKLTFGAGFGAVWTE